MNKVINNAIISIKQFFYKNAPTILIASGFAATVGAGVLAVIKAPKIKEKYDEDLKALENVDKCLEAHTDPNGEEYTIQDAIKDTRIIKTTALVKAVGRYAPEIGMVAGGGAMIFTGNHINNKRLANSMAAYATLSTMFRNYRDQVEKKYGKQEDIDMRMANEKDDEDKETPVEKFRKSKGPYSDYARIFDEVNSPGNFKPMATYNRFFLDSMQRQANDILNRDGILFLNQVYEMLGMEKTEAGQIVGWVKNSATGDHEVRFNHDNPEYESSARFMQGLEAAVILDFNVDGEVLYFLPKI